MDGRLCFGVLAAFLLISVAVGVRDAAAVGGRRLVTEKKEGERSEAGQGATARPGEDSRAQPVTPSDSKPAARVPPPNPPAAAQKDSPLTPVSANLSNHAPVVPVSASPSGPPPAPGGPVNPQPSSAGSPLDKSPPSGGPPPKLPASHEHLNPSPVLGNHPVPPESKLPNPAPSGHGRESPPTSEKGGKEKENKQQPGTSPNPDDGSQGKGRATERCNVPVPHRCNVKGLLACLRQSQNGAQKWFLFVQNEGESLLKVNIQGPSSVKLDKSVSLPVSLQPHEGSKINIQVDAVEGQNIFLETGNGNCTLHMTQQSSSGSFFQQLPNYANQVTPMHGVYLASLTVIFVGGTWACCQFRKRRRVDAGVAYQQLEMGTQQQSSNDLDDEGSTNGWDDGWNDDWDDEEAASRPPEKRESASQNGAAVRSSDKNEWEDWDD